MNNIIPFGKPIIGNEEYESIKKVLESGILVHGEKTKEFEKEFANRVGSEFAISVSSCTAGLHLALFCSGIKEGDKVAVPAMTHVATAHVVELSGATPIFIDVEKETGNMDIEKLFIASKEHDLNAIIPVHYLGLPCNMDKINEIAKSNNSLVIEDCALAMDAKYGSLKAGNLGDCASFSFYPVKHMTSVEGGMVTTNNPNLAELIKKKKAFGYNKSLGERSRPGQYDVDQLGFNYRMNEIEAAVGLCQLERLDKNLKIRERNYKILYNKLKDLDKVNLFPNYCDKSFSSYYCFNLVLSENCSLDRDLVQDHLKNVGIGSSIHYPSAVPLFTYYSEKYFYKKGDFPISEWLGARTISLPVGPHIDEDQINYLANKTYEILTR